MKRKDDHIKYALNCEFKSSLDDIDLKYYSILKYALKDVDLSTTFCGIKQKFPIYINAMTGGSEKADMLNKRLEKICEKLGIFMFSGSYSANLKENKYYYPKNMGVNLGADKSFLEMKKAIEQTKAKILQIHLNPMQELIMQEGDKDFSNIENNIKAALKHIDIPIIVKETGYGMSFETIEKLYSFGVKTVDISGKGGTNFSYIEDMRNGKNRPYLYNIGYSTKQSLLNAQKYIDKMEVLASGGIENALDVVKCLAMGAKAVGLSLYVLKLLENDDNYVCEKLLEMIEEIKILMLITNSKNISQLVGKWEERK